MKTFKIMLAMLAFAFSIVSCNRDNVINSTNPEQEKTNNISSRIAKSEQINILFNGNRYELLEDKSVAYYNTNNNYVGDLILGSYDMNVVDNSVTSGEVTIENPSTNEIITIKNIRHLKETTIFDVETSNGKTFSDIEAYQINSTSKFPVAPIVRAVVAIVTVIAVSTSSGGTQNDCTASMPKNCPQGSKPYAEYSSGWFSSSCNVGCR